MKSFLKKLLVYGAELCARLVLRKFQPKIVAITGSVGKTTTKEMLLAIMQDHFDVRANERSYNTEIGVPITVLGVSNPWSSVLSWLNLFATAFELIILRSNYPKWLILETGVEYPGDMKRLTRYLKPDITVVTAMGDQIPVHSEFFDGPEGIAREKVLLVKATKEDGTVVYNLDDQRVVQMVSGASQSLVTFGGSEDSTVRGLEYEMRYEDKVPVGLEYRVETPESSSKVLINSAIGHGYFYTSLAAISTARNLDISLEDAVASLAQFTPAPGRGVVLSGLRGSTIIDESYNFSPAAGKAALANFANMKAKRKIVALSKMTELGDGTVTQHKEAAKWVLESDTQLFCTVGNKTDPEIVAYHDYFKANKGKRAEYLHFESSDACGTYLNKEVKEGDIILVKGSQSSRMERCVEQILADPDSTKNVLVRQDPEWLER